MILCKIGRKKVDAGGEIHVFVSKSMMGSPRLAASCPVCYCDGSRGEAGCTECLLSQLDDFKRDSGQLQAAGVNNVLSMVATVHVAYIYATSYTCKRKYRSIPSSRAPHSARKPSS